MIHILMANGTSTLKLMLFLLTPTELIYITILKTCHYVYTVTYAPPLSEWLMYFNAI
jgi:hypothetical protein